MALDLSSTVHCSCCIIPCCKGTVSCLLHLFNWLLVNLEILELRLHCTSIYHLWKGHLLKPILLVTWKNCLLFSSPSYTWLGFSRILSMDAPTDRNHPAWTSETAASHPQHVLIGHFKSVLWKMSRAYVFILRGSRSICRGYKSYSQMTNYWYFEKLHFSYLYFLFYFQTFDEQVFAICNTRLYSRPSLCWQPWWCEHWRRRSSPLVSSLVWAAHALSFCQWSGLLCRCCTFVFARLSVTGYDVKATHRQKYRLSSWLYVGCKVTFYSTCLHPCQIDMNTFSLISSPVSRQLKFPQTTYTFTFVSVIGYLPHWHSFFCHMCLWHDIHSRTRLSWLRVGFGEYFRLPSQCYQINCVFQHL